MFHFKNRINGNYTSNFKKRKSRFTRRCTTLLADYLPAQIFLRIFDAQCFDKKWDEINKRVKPSFPNAQEINSWILEKQSELEKSWLKAKRENVSIQVHELKEQIYGKAEIDFFEVTRENYNSFKEKGKINTWRRSVSIINKFQECLKVERIVFNEKLKA